MYDKTISLGGQVESSSDIPCIVKIVSFSVLKRKKISKLNIIASAINCYVCNATDSATPFQCGEWFERFDTPDIEPQDCSGVHGAKYCIKHIGRFEGTPN